MSILAEAEACVLSARQAAYGHPAENFARTARLWSVVLETAVTPEQVALCMILVKVARELHAPKRDNRVDIAGYAQTLEMVHAYKAAAQAE
ncbi:MAG: hypothetical protein D6781_01550 [Verrucomicrobia bacterium]|nr:MAG: hypothetical protein D6781_01550 [Verrucomicrobiota bacterium]